LPPDVLEWVRGRDEVIRIRPDQWVYLDEVELSEEPDVDDSDPEALDGVLGMIAFQSLALGREWYNMFGNEVHACHAMLCKCCVIILIARKLGSTANVFGF
jgi:hypothetical protein